MDDIIDRNNNDNNGSNSSNAYSNSNSSNNNGSDNIMSNNRHFKTTTTTRAITTDHEEIVNIILDNNILPTDNKSQTKSTDVKSTNVSNMQTNLTTNLTKDILLQKQQKQQQGQGQHGDTIPTSSNPTPTIITICTTDSSSTSRSKSSTSSTSNSNSPTGSRIGIAQIIHNHHNNNNNHHHLNTNNSTSNSNTHHDNDHHHLNDFDFYDDYPTDENTIGLNSLSLSHKEMAVAFYRSKRGVVGCDDYNDGTCYNGNDVNDAGNNVNDVYGNDDGVVNEVTSHVDGDDCGDNDEEDYNDDSSFLQNVEVEDVVMTNDDCNHDRHNNDHRRGHYHPNHRVDSGNNERINRSTGTTPTRGNSSNAIHNTTNIHNSMNGTDDENYDNDTTTTIDNSYYDIHASTLSQSTGPSRHERTNTTTNDYNNEMVSLTRLQRNMGMMYATTDNNNNDNHNDNHNDNNGMTMMDDQDATTTINSYYDIHASTLSLSTSSQTPGKEDAALKRLQRMTAGMGMATMIMAGSNDDLDTTNGKQQRKARTKSSNMSYLHGVVLEEEEEEENDNIVVVLADTIGEHGGLVGNSSPAAAATAGIHRHNHDNGGNEYDECDDLCIISSTINNQYHNTNNIIMSSGTMGGNQGGGPGPGGRNNMDIVVIPKKRGKKSSMISRTNGTTTTTNSNIHHDHHHHRHDHCGHDYTHPQEATANNDANAATTTTTTNIAMSSGAISMTNSSTSALTDEYFHDLTKRTASCQLLEGISESSSPTSQQQQQKHQQQLPQGRNDVVIIAAHGDGGGGGSGSGIGNVGIGSTTGTNIVEEEPARPPPMQSVSPELHYQSSTNLEELISFPSNGVILMSNATTRTSSGGGGGNGSGEGYYDKEGFVDEEAAMKFSPLRTLGIRSTARGGRADGKCSSPCGLCCNWFSNSSRTIKVVIAVSVLLLLLSVSSVAIGVLLQKDKRRASGIASADGTGMVVTQQQITVDDGSKEDATGKNDAVLTTSSVFPTIAPSGMQLTDDLGGIAVSHPPTTIDFFLGRSEPVPMPATSVPPAPIFTSSLDPPTFLPTFYPTVVNGDSLTISKPAMNTLLPTTISNPSLASVTNAPISVPTPPTPVSKTPTFEPSYTPTIMSDDVPSAEQWISTTKSPITTSDPTPNPTRGPTPNPSRLPTNKPSRLPTDKPTRIPTEKPNRYPTPMPSNNPSRNPTRQPSRYPTNKPSQQPSNQPSKKPSVKPSRYQTMQPTVHPLMLTTYVPTNGPTKEPSLIPTESPSRSPTLSPTSAETTRLTTNSPSKLPSIAPTLLPTLEATTLTPTSSPTVISTTFKPTVSPVKIQIDPASSINFVPPGCPTNDDSDLPGAVGPMELGSSVHIMFPTKDSYVRGGDYEDENYGSENVLELNGKDEESNIRKVLLEFDLASLSKVLKKQDVVSASIRLFVESVGKDYTRSVSIYKLSNNAEWYEDQVTWSNFGTPPLSMTGPTFQVTWSDENEWIDVDITNLIGRSDETNLVLGLRNTSTKGKNSNCSFGSRETCHSPKLVLVTEPI